MTQESWEDKVYMVF